MYNNNVIVVPVVFKGNDNINCGDTLLQNKQIS